MKLAEAEQAFAALRAACRGDRSVHDFECASGPLERLRRALVDETLTGADRLVRLRHALRHTACSAEFGEVERSLPLPMSDLATPDSVLACFGLVRRPSGEVSAKPWRPNWLAEVPEQGADHSAMQAALRPWTHKPPAADPWVQTHLGFKTYRGPGQALAVRSALHLPPGKTLVVVLPTGEGKSLVFHALAQAHPDQVIAVVVPTVALALDQEMSLKRQSAQHSRYHAYVGGDAQRATAISTALRDGRQGLLFAAPEAYTASLRDPLLQAARQGRLASLVIDEAHLVDAWGTDFRSDFQSLAALVAELRMVAPPEARPRVVCLSATLSQMSFDTLEALFEPQGHLALVAATRLRPEQDLWVAALAPNLEVRAQRVIDALCALPRPAVLYVTQREEAEAWRRRLKAIGFGSIGVVHGDTDSQAREQVLQQWRAGNLDLVIGTSAFGLGIDLDSVRAIVHACVPETLDRYYQEIGRAGRDNRSAVGVLIPAVQDLPIAEQLSRKTVISEEKGRARWRSLFESATRVDGPGHQVLVDVSTAPSYDPDLQSGRNEDWNINVLNLLARAGVVRYAGIKWRSEDNRVLLAVDICDPGHLTSETWETRIRPLRERVAKSNALAHKAVRSLLDESACPSGLFARMYELKHEQVEHGVTLACGGCVVCRRERSDRWFAQWPLAPRAPFEIGSLPPRWADVFGPMGRRFVGYMRQNLGARRFQRNLRDLTDGLWRVGLRKFVLVGDVPPGLLEALARNPWCVAASQVPTVLTSSGLPPGPVAIWLAPGVELPAGQLLEDLGASRRLLIVPADLGDPRYPGHFLTERIHVSALASLVDDLNQ